MELRKLELCARCAAMPGTGNPLTWCAGLCGELVRSGPESGRTIFLNSDCDLSVL